MKISKFKANLITYPIFILFLCFVTNCVKWDPPDLRKIPGSADEKREKNLKEGKGFRLNSAIKNRMGGSGSFLFASSNEMWRATLELLDFTPLHNVDYSGGVIITDWFSENNNQEAMKITVRFLSNEIRADGLIIVIHKKVCKQINDCKVTKIKSSLSQEIKLAILKKAAIIKDNELSKDPNYELSPTGDGEKN